MVFSSYYLHIFLLFSVTAGKLLLPFGIDHKDTQLDKGDENCGPKVELPGQGFTFLDKLYQSVVVCTNGFLSFTTEVHRLWALKTLQIFPIVPDISILAPFWADISTEGTTEPDSANAIFYRIENRSYILREVDTIMMSKSSYPEFRAAWVFVATWNRVKHYEQSESNLNRNTFQVAITCDSKNENLCFAFFSYKELAWTSDGFYSDAAAGWNDGYGKFQEVIHSRTPEIKTLPNKTNIVEKGVFMFDLSGGRSPSETNNLCPPTISPSEAYIYTEPRSFSITGFYCDGSTLDKSDKVEILFSGDRYQVKVPGIISPDLTVISGSFPFWGRIETEVKVFVSINGIQNPNASVLNFYSRLQKLSMNDVIDVSYEEDSAAITFTWDEKFFDASAKLIPRLLRVTDKQSEDDSLNPFTVKSSNLNEIKNNGRYTTTLNDGGFAFLQLYQSDSEVNCLDTATSHSLAPCAEKFLTSVVPIVSHIKTTCSNWINKELTFEVNDLSKWYEPLDVYYGCPRKPSNHPNVFPNEIITNTDAYFAREEIDKDVKGWKYDPCCLEGTSPLLKRGFCSNCEFNEGAKFCIVSPAIEIKGTSNGRPMTHSTSNQCCYDASEKLITTRVHGAGRVSKEINTLYNTLAHYQSDIAPYKSCCLGRKSSPRLCNQFHDFRPVVKGKYYVPSYVTMTIVQRDPHFRTLDGAEYTFNGLGVYTLLALNASDTDTSLDLQVSMRRVGDGTVLSGFFLKDGKSTVEGYLPPNSKDLSVHVNGIEFKLHQFREYQLGGIEIRETSPTEYTFMSLSRGLAAKVMITDSSILNVATIPPLTLMDDVMGLLGNFDGDVKNDLRSKNGTLLPIGTSMDKIHEVFGESWKVEEENWLFSFNFAQKIHEDIRRGLPYTAVYEPQFKDSTEQKQIEEACDGDKTCILDVSLTKDFVFANTTKTIKNVTKVVEVIAEEYKEETEKVVKVIREKKVEEKKKKAEAKKNKEEGFLKRIWNYLTSK